MAVLDTSELRWFADGLPPRAVVDWFTCGGTVGTLEERCDTYQLHRLHDIGVKRRSRTTLEVKVRREIGGAMTLAPDLTAPFEEWRKWSPTVEDPMSPSADTPWIDIEKAVLTRTFMLGDERGRWSGAARGRHPVGMRRGDRRGDGRRNRRMELGIRGLRAQDASEPGREGGVDDVGRLVRCPEQLGSYFAFVAGYPEWLARIAEDLDGRSAGGMTHLTG